MLEQIREKMVNNNKVLAAQAAAVVTEAYKAGAMDAIDLVEAQQSVTINSLRERVKLAETCMATAWANSGPIPNGGDVVAPLKSYREKYPTALTEELKSEKWPGEKNGVSAMAGDNYKESV